MEKLDDIIERYVKESTDNRAFPTGWILSASLSPLADMDGDLDSYFILTSDGLPIHTQLGLLDRAKNDIENMMLLSTIGQNFGMIFRNMRKGENDD